MYNQESNLVLTPLPQESAPILQLKIPKAKPKPNKRSISLFECQICGKQFEADDWPTCGRGHKEVGMALLMSKGKSGCCQPLSEQNNLKLEVPK